MSKKHYRYKDNDIIRTGSTTTVSIPMPGGSSGHYEAVRNLYRIEGEEVTKSAGKRPFITSIAEAKEYINDTLFEQSRQLSPRERMMQRHRHGIIPDDPWWEG